MSKKNIYISIGIVVAVIILIIAGIYVDSHAKIYTGIPTSNSQTTQTTTTKTGAVVLGDYGAAPDFTGITNWLNSPPLTIASLKGKVVLIDFWTYSCINCIRTLPYVTKWYNEYNQDGLVVVGVHTPEFAFEKDTANVQNAITQFGIKYPVAQDNNYGTWSAYNNEYWPAEYLINQQGQIVEEHFGEGNYAQTENDIRQLLGLTPNATESNQDLSGIGSPEMYFGTERLANLTPTQSSSPNATTYTIDPSLALNTFTLGGTWQFSGPNITLVKPNGEINLKFHSANLYMVASSLTPTTLTITVDGKPQPSVTVQASKLYTLFSSSDYADHTVQIKINNAGFEGFTFTFG